MGAEFNYAVACLPDRCRILGVTLRPFLVGHLLLLHRIKSPFVCGGAVDAQKLAEAVTICAGTYAQGAKRLNRRRNPIVLVRATMAALRSEFKPGHIRRHADALEAYILEAQREPRGIVKYPANGGVTHAATVLVKVLDFPHRPFAALMETPLAQVIYERYGQLALPENGKVIEWRPPWMGPTPRERKEMEAAGDN